MNVRLLFPVLLLCCFNLQGQNALVISVPNITVNPNNDFVIPVKTQNFTSVSSFSFSLVWDTTMIDFVDIISINSDLPLNSSNFNILQTHLGKLAVSWFDISGLGKSLADNTVLFEIKFKTLTTPGSTLLKFTDDLAPVIAENLQGILPVSASPGTITIPTVSTNETLILADVNIYPNPAQGYVTLHCSLLDASPVIVEVTDLNGTLLERQKYTSTTDGELKMNLSPLSSGNYLIRMVSEKGIVSKLFSIIR